jgi:hypothetical protein
MNQENVKDAATLVYKKTRRFNMYSDPGHAWVKVKLDLLNKLGVTNKISHFSYMRHSSNGKLFVYLEIACDVDIFGKALQNSGIDLIFDEHRTDFYSKIRGYDNFTPNAANIVQ